MISQSPDWLFDLYPASAISQRKIDSFVVSDLLADVITGSPSTWGGVYMRGSAGYQNTDWQRMGADLKLTNIGFARFLPGGIIESKPGKMVDGAFGGLYVTPVQRALPMFVSGAGSPTGGTGSNLGWTSNSGTFTTIKPRSGNGSALSVSGIMNAGTGEGRATSNSILGINQSIECHFDFFRAGNEDALYYHELGPRLRLALLYGRPPALERRITETVGGTARDRWTTWQRLDEYENWRPSGNHYRFALGQIGGRLTYEWNDKSGWLLDENDQFNNTAPLGIRARAAIPTWGGQAMKIQVVGAKVAMELSTRDHKNIAGNALQTATAVRRVPLTAAGSYAPRLLDPLAVGFTPAGGDIDVQVAHDSEGLTYTATLKPDPSGFLSPCLAQMLLVYKPVWVNGSGNPINITRAVINAHVTLGQPPEQAGSEGDITIDMHLLEKKLPTAVNMLQDFAPIEVSARWRNDATAQPISAYRGLMQGYLNVETGEQSGFNRHTVKFGIKDEMLRLRDEAALVDEKFYDLIMEFQKVTKERIGKALKELTAGDDPDGYHNPFEPKEYIPVSAGNFYGADCAKGILELQCGPGFASRLNGNGDVTRFLPKNHPPLLNKFDMSGSIAPLAAALGQTLGIGSLSNVTNGMFFPPPYGDDVFSWLLKIANDELCQVWVGHADRDTDSWPDPLYGKYEEYLNQAKGWKLGAKAGGDLASLIEAASNESRPNKAYNCVKVWSDPFGISSDIPNRPSLITGEARVAAGPNAPHNSWLRTLLVKGGFANWITTPRQAATFAALVLLDYDFDSGRPIAPKFKVTGDARFLVGDVFFASNLKLRGVNNAYLRSTRIEHEYTCDPSSGRWWTTSPHLATMTRSQVERFKRNNAGGYTFD